jgi:hypothetical protein
MIAFHSVLPEVAQREVRCVLLGSSPDATLEAASPAEEYAYLEFYCDDLDCDCRRVFLQVISKGQPGKVFASIGYGWEREAFYRKRMPWDPDAVKGIAPQREAQQRAIPTCLPPNTCFELANL